MHDPIVVVGGSRGIGRALVERFGARAVAWARGTGVDATDRASVTAARERLVREHGVPWAVVHCVGDFDESPLLGTDQGTWHRMFESNVASALIVVQELVPLLVTAGRGRVVLFSAAGVEAATAKTRAPFYFAAKAALESLARSLALDVAASGVRVHVVAPGLIAHPHSHMESQRRMAARVPLGRLGTPLDVVDVVEHLLDPGSDYATGGVWTVDGGLSL